MMRRNRRIRPGRRRRIGEAEVGRGVVEEVEGGVEEEGLGAGAGVVGGDFEHRDEMSEGRTLVERGGVEIVLGERQ